MKIVHAADLHIDSPFLGLVRYDGAPVDRVRGATRRAFENVIELCLAEDARFLVLAGDVFDAGWKDAAGSGGYFLAQLNRLRETKCTVLLLRGNHDHDLTRTLDFPDHVKEFQAPGGATGARKKAGTSHVFEREGVVFHGVSYASQKVTETLLPGYPEPLPDLLNVGVLHTNATGSALHAPYAPCSIGDLLAKQYGYWALGHVHEHKILHRDPYIVYPGNTQGRSVRETGAKGCVLLDVDGTRVEGLRFVATDVMRYFDEDVVLAREDDRDELHAAVRARLSEVVEQSEGRLAAVRVTLRGACRAHAAVVTMPETIIEQVRADVAGSMDVWVEKIDLRTSPAVSIDELREAKGLLADLLAYTHDLASDEAGADRAALARTLEPLKKKVARQLEAIDLRVGDDAWMIDVIAQAEALLVELLTRGEP
jgi:DNA repair exonuclease SbcCD nuclease subunit